MWSHERTAGTQLGWAGPPAVLSLLAALALLAGTRPAAAQAPDVAERLPLRITLDGALEIEFFASQGKSYAVEALVGDGAGTDAWIPIYGPIYGADARVRDFLATDPAVRDLRLIVRDLGPLGRAPADLAGHSYALTSAGVARALFFATEDAGVEHGKDGVPRGFTYSSSKVEPDVARVEIEFVDSDVREAIELRFEAGRVGVFESSVSVAGRRPSRSAGTFRAGDDVDPANAAPPAELEGGSFVFRDRALRVAMGFGTDAAATLSRQGAAPEAVRYTYQVTGARDARLVVEAGGGERHEVAMQFGARNSGMFVRHTVRGGKVVDTDRGDFSGKKADDADDDGNGRRDTAPGCAAPEQLEGKTLRIAINSTVATIVFSGAATGSVFHRRANGRISFKPFTYRYSKEASTEGLLTITFPTAGGNGKDREVYRLAFASDTGGDCVRRRYEADELDDTDQGTFTIRDAQSPQGNEDDD